MLTATKSEASLTYRVYVRYNRRWVCYAAFLRFQDAERFHEMLKDNGPAVEPGGLPYYYLRRPDAPHPTKFYRPVTAE